MRRINMVHVESVIGDLMSYATGEECVTESFITTLKDENDTDIKKAVSVGFKKTDREKVLADLVKNEGRTVDKFRISPVNGCLISIYDPKYGFGRQISFDRHDDFPIKSMIPDDYAYVKEFFERFLNFREDLIRNRQVVKEDDIFQYLASITGGFSPKKASGKVGKQFRKK